MRSRPAAGRSPSAAVMPNVIARVSGMLSASSTAERHSQNPMSATSTTRATASHKLFISRWTFSSTCSGWSEVRARIRSGGSRSRSTARAESTAWPKSPIFSPGRIWSASVTARPPCHCPRGVRPAVLVEVPRRVLVLPVDVHQVPQIERHAGARAADDDAADLALVLEFPARVQLTVRAPTSIWPPPSAVLRARRTSCSRPRVMP